MEELLKKLSSYNIFNYLLPGVVFVVLAKEVFGYSLYVDNIVLGIFYYYFYGLVISRFGSIVIEPLLSKIKIIQLLEYPRFVRAQKIDPKIETLSESNNMFRTIIAMVVCLGILKLTLWISSIIPNAKGLILAILLCLLFMLFVLGYRKQCSYISKRIIESEGDIKQTVKSIHASKSKAKSQNGTKS
jgi:hypothetical protein